MGTGAIKDFSSEYSFFDVAGGAVPKGLGKKEYS
jgi:hypothetical protein